MEGMTNTHTTLHLKEGIIYIDRDDKHQVVKTPLHYRGTILVEFSPCVHIAGNDMYGSDANNQKH